MKCSFCGLVAHFRALWVRAGGTESRWVCTYHARELRRAKGVTVEAMS